MNVSFFVRRLAAAALFLLAVVPAARAVLPNAWHVADISIVSGSGGSSPSMRAPRFEFGNGSTVRVFSGVQKFGNSFGTANQTGGALFYKGVSQSTWQSVALSFHANSGNDQFWFADLNTSNVPADEVIQYYLYLTFDSGAENAYLWPGATGGDGGSAVTNSPATAVATPFTVRNRAAFVFHAGNRVLAGSTTQFLAKVGYVPKDNNLSKKWVSNGAVYYTTDGTAPTGALGVPSGTTQAVAMVLDHLEGDQSAAGNAMWWRGDVNGLPTFTTIRYRIGLWNTQNNEEKFADYLAPTDSRTGTTFQFSIGTNGDPSLTVNGTEANYTTTHTYINEVLGTSTTFNLRFVPNDPNCDPATVQVFTNLNRRDLATLKYYSPSDTDPNRVWTEEGIQPPSGDLVGTDDAHYYKAYPMAGTVAAGFTATLNATKTGAYRLTARYRRTGEILWRYYSDAGRRDHALVVSPDSARDMRMYELNAMTVESAGHPGRAALHLRGPMGRPRRALLQQRHDALEPRLRCQPRDELAVVPADPSGRDRGAGRRTRPPGSPSRRARPTR